MPRKKAEATAGMKLLGLYCLLLFSGRAFSLPDLAEKLECSKQAVMRLMRNIELSGWAYIETGIGKDRKRWYQLRTPRERPQVSLSADDLQGLLLCRDMVWHLLPETLRSSVSRTIGHASVLLHDSTQRGRALSGLAKCRPKGGVDYSEKGTLLADIMNAIRGRQVCRVLYSRPRAKTAKEYYWAPFRLIAHRDALYAEGWLLWKDAVPPEVYEVTFAVHRIRELELTKRTYTERTPKDSGHTPMTFGLIEGEPFRVRIAFGPSAACYVSERLWSDDQNLEPQPDGGVILDFSSTS